MTVYNIQAYDPDDVMKHLRRKALAESMTYYCAPPNGRHHRDSAGLPIIGRVIWSTLHNAFIRRIKPQADGLQVQIITAAA